MTEILFKLGILGAVSLALTAILDLMPVAEPLPTAVTTGINWFVEQMYFFDAIIDIQVFFECCGYLITAFFWYFLLQMVIKIMRWVFLAS